MGLVTQKRVLLQHANTPSINVLATVHHIFAKLIKYTCLGAIVVRNIVHTCSQKGTTKEVEVGKISDVTAEMKQMILDSCIDDATKCATDVAEFPAGVAVGCLFHWK